jgi:DNA-binding MurR/RpiR family transcriptional regulator
LDQAQATEAVSGLTYPPGSGTPFQEGLDSFGGGVSVLTSTSTMLAKQHLARRAVSRARIAEILEQGLSTFTPTGKRIASYMLADLQHLPFETADSIARMTGTTGISVGRFLRQIGFQNLDDLKRSIRGATGRPWFQTERLSSYRQHSEERGALEHSLELELDAIRHVYQLAGTPEFARVADRIAQADAVFVIGLQAQSGVMNTFFTHLEYIRPRVYYANGVGGAYVESLNSEYRSPYLIISDFRAYSSMTRRYCQAAAQRKLPLLLITDFYCTWARDFPVDLLQLKIDVRQFWDTWSPLTCLLNLFLSAVVERLGSRLADRLTLNKKLQKELGQFEL